MRRNISCLVLFFFCVVWGCQSHGLDAESAFIKEYQRAHEQRDVDGAMNLVYWQGVNEDIKQNFIGNFKDDFKMEIEKLEMVRPPENQMTQYTSQGKTFKTNLDVKKVFIVHLKPQPGAVQITYTKYLIGVKDGKYYITTAVPVE